MTNEATDFGQLKPMVEQAAGNLKTAGVDEAIGVVVAAGHLSDDNLALEEELKVELVIATKSRKHAGANRDRPRGRIPNDLSRTQRMERKLRTKRGDHLYRKRAVSIEPVLGQQRQRGMGRFRRRGLKACECEWRFEHAVHNLLKIRTSGKWTTAQKRGTSRAAPREQRITLAFRCHSLADRFLRQPLTCTDSMNRQGIEPEPTD